MDDNGSDSKFIWHIISLMSWIIFILTIWFSYNESYFIWSLFGSKINNGIYNHQIYYMPIQMNMSWLNIFIFLISVIGSGLYFFYTTIKMNQNLYNGMLSNWSKFHFIPLLFISALYIVTEHNFNSNSNYKHIRTLLIFDLIFTLLGLVGLILIYLKMDLQCEWYFVFAIKKGVFSTFIVLLWYNFFNVIIYLKSVNYIINDDLDVDSFYNFYMGTGISFSIIIGIGSLAFSFFFRDIMAAFVNFLIYVGFILYFFTKEKDEIEEIKEDFNGYADAIIDIIIMAISFSFIPFLIIFYKKALFN
jgi:hypothetical protein